MAPHGSACSLALCTPDGQQGSRPRQAADHCGPHALHTLHADLETIKHLAAHVASPQRAVHVSVRGSCSGRRCGGRRRVRPTVGGRGEAHDPWRTYAMPSCRQARAFDGLCQLLHSCLCYTAQAGGGGPVRRGGGAWGAATPLGRWPTSPRGLWSPPREGRPPPWASTWRPHVWCGVASGPPRVS